MGKHTPGPWSSQGRFIGLQSESDDQSFGMITAIIATVDDVDLSGDWKANARLIAAEAELRIQRELATQFEAGAALLIVRAERAEAELAESDRVLAIHKRDYEAHFKAHREELAMCEKALEQFYCFEGEGLRYVTPLGWKDAPELAEWLKTYKQQEESK